MNRIDDFWSMFQQNVAMSQAMIDRVIWTIVVLGSFWVLRRVLKRAIATRIEEVDRRYLAIKTVNYSIGMAVVVSLIAIWVWGGAGVGAYLGIVSAGLAIALQTPLSNLAGWVFITVRKPFTLGDRVQIGDVAGDVIDLRPFAFSIIEIGNWVNADQSTGRIIHIPNGWVFSKAIANYTQGFSFIWHEIPVTVTFESNWEKAKAILTEIAKKHAALQSHDAAEAVRKAAEKYLIRFTHLTPIVWTKVIDFGVMLTIRYPVDARQRRSSEQAIWEDMLREFRKHDDIDFAYPTTRFYDNREEGKPGMGGG